MVDLDTFIPILGWLGLILSLVYKVPQIQHLYTVKKADGLSLSSISLQTTNYVVWIVYSILKEDNFNIATNVLSLILNMVLHVMTIYYKWTYKAEKVD